MNNKELIASFLNNVREGIVSDLQTKKISEGDLNMRVNAEDLVGELSGGSYWYFLVHGRKPGKQPPSDSIRGWLEKKGIISEGITIKALAYLVARKIGQQGTDIFLGKRPGLDLEGIIKTNNEGFIKTLSENYRLEFTDMFTKSFKLIFS